MYYKKNINKHTNKWKISASCILVFNLFKKKAKSASVNKIVHMTEDLHCTGRLHSLIVPTLYQKLYSQTLGEDSIPPKSPLSRATQPNRQFSSLQYRYQMTRRIPFIYRGSLYCCDINWLREYPLVIEVFCIFKGNRLVPLESPTFIESGFNSRTEK